MKSALALRQVEVGNVGEVADFTIKANGKAFKVLIDGLYSDKVLAVVRELCSNAFDSHAAAGNSDPFDLHLPTTWAPHFSVRDYGTSLSHNDVMHLYTTVFESSKENTDTQVGKLGLGSKSPFAYTDTFTVTAWMDGVKRSYSAFIGETYVPKIAFMGEEPSDEPTGFEVSFPVKTNDIQLFMSAAKKFVLGLDQTPKMVGGSSPSIKSLADCQTQFVGDGWWVFNDQNITTTYARQGCVLYPIDRHALESFLGMSVAGLGVGMIIDFPIGELEIAANREALGYDAPTCGNIAKRITPIIAELGTLLRQDILDAPTLLEATRRWSALKNNYSIPDAIRHEATRSVMWRGRPVGHVLSLPMMAIHYGHKRGDFAVMTASNSTVLARRKGLTWNRMNAADVTPNTIVYVQDMDKADINNPKSKSLTLPERRIRRYHQRHGVGHNILWIKTRMSSRAWKLTKALLAGATFVTVNALELPTVAAPGSGDYSRRPVQVKVYAARNTGKGSYFEETHIVATEGGYYVDLERDEVRHGERLFSHGYLHTIIQDARKLGLLDAATPIYGIPKSLSKLLGKSDAWVNIFDLIKDAAEAKYSTYSLDIVTWQRHAAWDDITSAARNFSSLAEAAIDDAVALKLGRFSGYVRFIRTMRDAHRTCNDAAKVISLLERLNVKVEPGDINAKRDTYSMINERFMKALNKRYPLFQWSLDKWSSVNSDKQKALFEYVNMIDA